MQPFLKTHAPPQVNISIDAQYPLVPAALQVQIGDVHGHAEHGFTTEKQLLLHLQMYTAVLIELAK
ncbi:MAG: hypothetical protein ACOH2S_02715 [Janthinobacterium svalbardensis]|uniref:Peptidase M20 dimerisation domain-containing protein n=1 Tax=Janthinobacterium svalbardensis TaxID=368607 RepID=A0A290WSY7_9BURK|nr:hypothetical protein [Janthinobacterium svalbardensis]ATD60002.1 hypothetical protein CNX70_07225 [Janthinobacterium svalbardensis]